MLKFFFGVEGINYYSKDNKNKLTIKKIDFPKSSAQRNLHLETERKGKFSVYPASSIDVS